MFKGNQNIRLVDTNKLLVNYHLNGRRGRHNDWIKCEVRFGEKYIPLIQELIQKALNRELSYNAKIVFRNGKIYLHISLPIELYLKYFSRGYANGSLIASFDFNSDRINMVILDRRGIIRETRTEWYSEVTSHGYPKNKAHTKRLQALGRLLKYAYHHGVGIVIFEDLDRIKRKKVKNRDKNANRKITRFPKRKLLQHAITMALKYGFKVYLVNPSYTSKLAEKYKYRLGLDKHTTSAYMLALKYLSPKTFHTLLYASQTNELDEALAEGEGGGNAILRSR